MSRLEVRAARLLLRFLAIVVLLEGGLWLHLLLDPTHAATDRAAWSPPSVGSPGGADHPGDHPHPHPHPVSADETPAAAGHDHGDESIQSLWLPFHRTGHGSGVEIPVALPAAAPTCGPFQVAAESRVFRAAAPPGAGPAGRHRVLLI